MSGKPGCFPWPVKPRWALVPYLSFPVSLLKLLKLCLKVLQEELKIQHGRDMSRGSGWVPEAV